jgi:hypothetical protein
MMGKMKIEKKQYKMMGEEKQYNWFLIMCSWDWNADQDAIRKFQWLYNYLNARNVPEKWADITAHPDDPRHALDFYNLTGLNLIGQRKFVIIGRATSNGVLQEISSNVTLETSIRVDVFPATFAHDFARLTIRRFDEIKSGEIPPRSEPLKRPEPLK